MQLSESEMRRVIVGIQLQSAQEVLGSSLRVGQAQQSLSQLPRGIEVFGIVRQGRFELLARFDQRGFRRRIQQERLPLFEMNPRQVRIDFDQRSVMFERAWDVHCPSLSLGDHLVSFRRARRRRDHRVQSASLE